MTNISPLLKSGTQHWATPRAVYDALDAEFHFNDDPCPYQNEMEDGLARAWGDRTFVNPPYGREIGKWVRQGYNESRRGKLVVMLIPSRTDTQWWHDYVMKATEIRFLRGRLKFGEATTGAPFPSAVVIFGQDKPTVRSLYYLKGIKDVMTYLSDVPAGDGVSHNYPRQWMGVSRDRLLELRAWIPKVKSD